MQNEARFGLPLSLEEALRADPSPDAAVLADLLADRPAPQTRRPPADDGRRWRAAVAGLAVLACMGVSSQASAANLEGRWEMTPSQSSFQEKVTGPAPDRATVVVSQDDPDRMAYELIESRGDAEVARGAYQISFVGGGSTVSVGRSILGVAAQRDAGGDVVISAPPVRGLHTVIHLRRTGPDTAVLEHDIEGPSGSMRLETISLVRADAPYAQASTRQPGQADGAGE